MSTFPDWMRELIGAATDDEYQLAQMMRPRMHGKASFIQESNAIDKALNDDTEAPLPDQEPTDG